MCSVKADSREELLKYMLQLIFDLMGGRGEDEDCENNGTAIYYFSQLEVQSPNNEGGKFDHLRTPPDTARHLLGFYGGGLRGRPTEA